LRAFRDDGRFDRGCRFTFFEWDRRTDRELFACLVLALGFTEVLRDELDVVFSATLDLRGLKELSVLAAIFPSADPILRAVDIKRLWGRLSLAESL